MITHNLESAAAFLNVSTDTMKDLAGNGVVPGAKIGKAWVFSDEVLEEYVREEIKRQTAARRGTDQNHPVRVRVPTAVSRNSRIPGRKPTTPPKLSSNA